MSLQRNKIWHEIERCVIMGSYFIMQFIGIYFALVPAQLQMSWVKITNIGKFKREKERKRESERDSSLQ